MMSGIRSAKLANGLRHEYVTQNGRVVRETVYALDNTTGEYTVFQYALDFTYDEAGHPLTMRRYNNANMQADYVTMQYVCNAQGDVVKLIYEGAVYAEYSYDAWGNAIIKSGSLDYENVNPLRYRGYYFDTESGFYYLQSRYYDPTLGRFLNADSYASTGQGFLGYNMFAYCQNNPIISLDYNGGKPRDIQDDYLPIPVRDPSEPIITGYDSSPKAVKEACDTAMNDITSEGGIVKDVSIVYNPNTWIGYPETNPWRVLGGAIAAKGASKIKNPYGKLFSALLSAVAFLDPFITGLYQNIESGRYETYTVTINWDLHHQDYVGTSYYTLYSYQTVFLVAVENNDYTISTWHDFTYTKEVSYALNYR